jgi:hypothetical protein
MMKTTVPESTSIVGIKQTTDFILVRTASVDNTKPLSTAVIDLVVTRCFAQSVYRAPSTQAPASSSLPQPCRLSASDGISIARGERFFFWKTLRSATGERPGLEYVMVVEDRPMLIIRPPSAALHG